MDSAWRQNRPAFSPRLIIHMMSRGSLKSTDHACLKKTIPDCLTVRCSDCLKLRQSYRLTLRVYSVRILFIPSAMMVFPSFPRLRSHQRSQRYVADSNATLRILFAESSSPAPFPDVRVAAGKGGICDTLKSMGDGRPGFWDNGHALRTAGGSGRTVPSGQRRKSLGEEVAGTRKYPQSIGAAGSGINRTPPRDASRRARGRPRSRAPRSTPSAGAAAPIRARIRSGG